MVVEDDPFMADALVTALTLEGYEARSFARVQEADDAIEAVAPDIALLDLNLDEPRDGLGLARRLRATSNLPIIFLSGSSSVDDRIEGLALGADDFVLKPFTMAELMARVEAVLRRADRVAAHDLEFGDLRVDLRAHRVTRAGVDIGLTRTEFALLATLMRHSGAVLSKRQLLSMVWDYDSFDENLVEVHVSSLRRKIERHGPRIIQTVRGVGYVLRAG